MNFKFRKIQTILIIFTLLLTLNICLTKNVSSALIKNKGNVKLEYDIKNFPRKIMPLSGEVVVPINVSYQVEGVLAKQAVNLFLKGKTATVDLKIKKTPKWCTAMIEPTQITPSISTTWSSEIVRVHVSFSEEAPAFIPVVIIIEMHAHEISNFFYKIENITKVGEISFTPDYLPIIDVTPKTTYKEIKPGKNTTFDIDITNLGNAETEFIFKIDELPSGWIATIPSNITIDSIIYGENYQRTVQLAVQTPNTPGYYNDIENIRLSVYGRYFASSETQMRTTTIYLTLQVRVRGTINDSNSSMIDVEPILLILSIVIAALIFIIIILALIIIKRD